MANAPIVELTRIESFSAAHRLHSDELSPEVNLETFGPCNNPHGHGHNYRWEVTLRGAVDASTGMVYNLRDLKREMKEVVELVDHKHLDKDVHHFMRGVVSTTENLAVFLFDQLKARMSSPELLVRVKLWETDKNVFVYRGDHSLLSDPAVD